MCVAISPDEKLIAVGGVDGLLTILDNNHNNKIIITSKIRAHKNWVNCIEFSHDG